VHVSTVCEALCIPIWHSTAIALCYKLYAPEYQQCLRCCTCHIPHAGSMVTVWLAHLGARCVYCSSGTALQDVACVPAASNTGCVPVVIDGPCLHCVWMHCVWKGWHTHNTMPCPYTCWTYPDDMSSIPCHVSAPCLTFHEPSQPPVILYSAAMSQYLTWLPCLTD
jgi:hypothetical protein